MHKKMQKAMSRLTAAVLLLSAVLWVFIRTPVKVMADEAAYTSEYVLSVSGGETYLTISSWITNPTKAATNINRYGQDGSDYYIVNGYTSNPARYTQVGNGIRFTNPNDKTKHSTTLKVSDWWKQKWIKQGSPTAPTYTTTSSSVTFKGSPYVGHTAYLFASWFKNKELYGTELNDVNKYNGGKAYLTTLQDPNTGYYRINGGSWVKCSLTQTIDFTKYKSGDKIEYRTVSALGHESTIKSVTVPKFTMVLNNNGSNTTMTMRYNTSDNSNVSAHNPAGAGSAFLGWYTSSGVKIYNADGTAVNDGTYWKNGKYAYYGNVTLYAKYVSNTLSIDLNGGMINVSERTPAGFIGVPTWENWTQTFTYGKKVPLSMVNAEETLYHYGVDSTPYRSCYTFKGWKVTAGGGSINSEGYCGKQVYMYNGLYNGNVTIQAQWTAFQYTVKYNGNEATEGNTASSIHTYDVAGKLTVNGFKRQGYAFAGWATSPGGPVVYTDGQSVKNLSEINGATVNLYAKWTDITAPDITATVTPAGWTNIQPKITATGTDGQSGMNRIEIYSPSGTVVASGDSSASYTVPLEGEQVYTVKGIDNSGNEIIKKVTAYYDKTLPTALINVNGVSHNFNDSSKVSEAYLMEWTNQDVDIIINGFDELSGVRRITLKDHYGNVIIETTGMTLKKTITAEGINHYTLEVADNAGNLKKATITIKIDKTAPTIKGETLLERDKINHQAIDTGSGVASYKLYDSDGREITEDDGLTYEEKNTIIYNTRDTYRLSWMLEAIDAAGNVTRVEISTPYNFSVYAELDNLRSETENFLVGKPADLNIWTYGYVDTIEIQFDSVITAYGEAEDIHLNYTKEQGNELVAAVPVENGGLQKTFTVPAAMPTTDCVVKITGWRNGYSKSIYLEFKVITEEELEKELRHRIRRTIISSTWD